MELQSERLRVGTEARRLPTLCFGASVLGGGGSLGLGWVNDNDKRENEWFLCYLWVLSSRAGWSGSSPVASTTEKASLLIVARE